MHSNSVYVSVCLHPTEPRNKLSVLVLLLTLLPITPFSYGKGEVIDIEGRDLFEQYSCCWEGGDVARPYTGKCAKAAASGDSLVLMGCEHALWWQEPTFTVDGGFPFQVQCDDSKHVRQLQCTAR